RNRFDQVLVQTDAACDRSADLRDLERMREARAEQVAFMVQKDLRLVDEAAKRRAMNDAVAVALELVAGECRDFRVTPPAARLGSAGAGVKHAATRRSAQPVWASMTSATRLSGALRT